MTFLSTTWAGVLYLAAAAAGILALQGLSSARTALPDRRGNLVGAGGALLAVAVTFFAKDAHLDHVPWILLAIAVGTAIAVLAGRTVRPSSIPSPGAGAGAAQAAVPARRIVALLDALGGAATAVVALLELDRVSGAIDLGTPKDLGVQAAIGLAVLAGAGSAAGSGVVFARLARLASEPLVIPGSGPLLVVGLVAGVGLALDVLATGRLVWGLLLLVVAVAVGALAVLPVGAPALPGVSCLLQALSGLAVAAVGFVLANILLVVAGTLVASVSTVGTVGTVGVLARRTSVSPSGGRAVTPEDVADLLDDARSVVVVPGYGLAVARAQHTLRVLADVLADRGTEVRYALHPMAGRLPGHLDVLLDEAGVPAAALVPPAEVGAALAAADVVLVVGANDVVNPAVGTDLPGLAVSAGRRVVVLTRSARPGFAGVENGLFHDARTSVLLGDAGAGLLRVLGALVRR